MSQSLSPVSVLTAAAAPILFVLLLFSSPAYAAYAAGPRELTIDASPFERPAECDATHAAPGLDLGGSGIDIGHEMPEGELPQRPVEVKAPGTDTTLCMGWEPTIAVSPIDPRIVVVAQARTIQVSYDGGDNFQPAFTAPLPAGFTGGGDPSLAFDSQGNLFITYLCSGAQGRDVCVTGYSCDVLTTSCSLLGGTQPVNLTAAVGKGGENADKQWIAADWYAGSPYQDRLYMIWSDLDQSPWQIWATWSNDQGQTWNGAQQISANDEGPKPWPSHITVGPDGFVYGAWHSQPTFLDAGQRVPDGTSGQIVLRRSEDGGASWEPRSFPYGPGEADTTWNVQHKANGVIPGARFWTQGTSQPWVLADPSDPNRVYVVANDDPDDDVDSGDAADVFIVISDDSGDSWGNPIRVDSGPAGTFQLLPTAAIDPITGAIAVAYYDNRASSDADNNGIFDLDWLVTRSLDGGLTWSAEVDFNDGVFDPDQSGQCRFCGSDGGPTNIACSNVSCTAPGTNRIGEYNGIAFGECTLHAAWADNTGPGCGGSTDTWYDRDPELGGDFTPPDIFCPVESAVECTVLPDPSTTGEATATDACDVDPEVDFTDQTLPGNCPQGNTREIIQRSWTATDAAGNQSGCGQLISINDTEPPVLSVPGDSQVECNGPAGIPANDPAIEGWLLVASADDVCGDETLADDAPAFFPAGCTPGGQDTLVTWTATDDCGNQASDSATMNVIDSTPPDVTAPGPIELECNGPGGVDLNDPQIQDWLAQATADDVCFDTTLANDAPPLFPFGCPPGGQETVVTFTATDECGLESTDDGSVTVVDTTPPEVVCGVDTATLWSPNHAFVDVGFWYTATDVCDPEPLDVAITVTSDEDPLLELGSGGPIHCPDAVVGGDESVLLRSERSGSHDGRVYAITVTATDSCGNASDCTANVFVPANQGAFGAAVDSGQLHDATVCE